MPKNRFRNACLWSWLLLLFCLPHSAALALPATGRSVPVSELSASPRWRALLHINTGATIRGRGHSYVDDDDFFLAQDGKRDAAAEMQASIQALQAPESPARCTFPARYRFLAEQLGWQDDRPLAHCDEYLNWRAQVPTGQLVLIFPAAYLNSPSSMFGHTLLRLDPEPDPDSTWPSLSINFGANIDTSDNSLFYAWRGLAGGYPGHFSTTPYATKIQEYSRVENRDIWEYALALDPDELDWLARHLWELKDINFDYFFLDENCSFRLLELIQVARPTAVLLQGLRFAEVPVKTVRSLYRAGLVADRRYRPSKASELNHLVSQLKGPERQLARQLKDDPTAADKPAYRALPRARRQLLARTAYQALRLNNREGQRDPDVARRSLQLLRLVRADSSQSAPLPIEEPAAPEAGHDTQRLSASLGVQDGRAYGEFGYRLTYHDLLDPAPGFLPGTAIEGLDLRLRATNGEGLKLEKLDLVDIRSLTPRNLFTKPVSWFVNGGLERALVGGDDRELFAFLQGGPGLSWQMGGWLPHVLSILRVENLSFGRGGLEIGGGFQAGVLHYANGFQWGLKGQMLQFEGGIDRAEVRADISRRLARNFALNGHCAYLEGEIDSQTACGLGMRFFYD